MPTKRGAVAEIALGLGIAALGAFILIKIGEIRVSPVYAKVGPRDIPIFIGGILAALGLALAWQGWRAKPAPRLDLPVIMDAPGSLLDAPGTAGSATDWLPLAAIAIGLVQQILLFEIAGFVPTAAILFFSVAFGFGSRRYLRDILIGVALSLVAYVGFVHALGLRLPAGILEGVL
jgi:putative tricarboxylic transport membrane protein